MNCFPLSVFVIGAGRCPIWFSSELTLTLPVGSGVSPICSEEGVEIGSIEKSLVIKMDVLLDRRACKSTSSAVDKDDNFCRSSVVVDRFKGVRRFANIRALAGSAVVGMNPAPWLTSEGSGDLTCNLVLETKGRPVDPNMHPNKASVSSRLSLTSRP